MENHVNLLKHDFKMILTWIKLVMKHDSNFKIFINRKEKNNKTIKIDI